MPPGTSIYTPAEDQAILAARAHSGDLRRLARSWGRTVEALRGRRQLLLGHTPAQKKLKPRPQRPPQITPRFARPAWFEEDLSRMTKGAI